MIARVECILGEVLSRGGYIELPLFPNKGTVNEMNFFQVRKGIFWVKICIEILNFMVILNVILECNF